MCTSACLHQPASIAAAPSIWGVSRQGCICWGVTRASAPAFAHIAACPPLNERRSLLVDFLGFGYSDKFRRLCALLGFTVLVRGSNEDCYVERKNRSRPKSSRKGSVFDNECHDLARPVANIGTAYEFLRSPRSEIKGLGQGRVGNDVIASSRDS